MLPSTMLRNAGIACLVFSLASCHPKPAAAAGTWRAVLTSPGGELPFKLRIARGRAVIINGAETRVLAYPKVKKSYSGFAGTGTGQHFGQLRTGMESVIETMIAEGKW